MKRIFFCFFYLSFYSAFAQSPESPFITHLSLDTASQEVHVYWNNVSPQTSGYIVYFQDETGLWIPLDTVQGINNTQYITEGSNARYGPETYSVVAFDAFGNNSARSESHKTIFLEHTYNECDSLCLLRWSSYENMFLGLGYRLHIYAGDGGNNLSLIETLDFTYADTAFQYPVDYSLKYYFILSAYNFDDTLARSNHTEMATTIIDKPLYSYVNKVSVNSNNEIEVHALSNSVDIDYFQIYRANYQGGFLQEVGEAKVNGLEGVFVDPLVLPEKNTYYYSANPVDVCGKEYQLPIYEGYPDTALVHQLKLRPLSLDKNEIKVSWNQYEGFLSLINHELWLDVNNEQMFLQDILDDTMSAVDVSSYVGKICVFALASEESYNKLGRKDSVYSNRVCLHKAPKVSIPNAFTPDNGDEKNDNWSAYYYGKEAIQSVHVSVHALSGQKVYESNDIDFQWDGTFKSNSIPSGTYVYQFSYIYGDGALVEHKGLLSVLR